PRVPAGDAAQASGRADYRLSGRTIHVRNAAALPPRRVRFEQPALPDPGGRTYAVRDGRAATTEHSSREAFRDVRPNRGDGTDFLSPAGAAWRQARLGRAPDRRRARGGARRF